MTENQQGVMYSNPPRGSIWGAMSIKYKLIMLTICTSLIGIFLMSLSFIWYDDLNYKKQLKQELNLIGSMLADRSNAALVFADTGLLQDNVNSLKLHDSIELGCIYDVENSVLSSFSRNQKLTCPEAPVVSEGVFTDDYFHLAQAIILDGDKIGALYIRSNLDELNRHFKDYVATTIVVALFVVVTLLLISTLLQRIVSTPLLHLAETATNIATQSDFSIRAPQESEDEIGQLVLAFNAMIEKIESQNKEILKSYENLEQLVEVRTAELKTANTELEAFSYSVSHDLRQPLRAIDGFSEAILEDCGDQLDEVAHDYFARVRAASQRMGHLIDSMLTLSRVTRHNLAKTEVDMTSLAESIVEHLKEQHPDRNIEVDIEKDMKVLGDEQLINIALSNLIGNAWKYTSKRELAKIQFASRVLDSNQIFFVKDNGAGFDMKYVDRLFTAFNRLHSPAEFEGSGIGLATVYRVINRHHGRIWAESVADEGSTFFFELPKKDEN